MPLIQPLFEFPGEASVIFLGLLICPWLGICLFPREGIVPPLSEFGLRHRVGESKGDELHHLALLPVGKRVAVFGGFLFRVVELGHGVECRDCSRATGKGDMSVAPP